MLPCIVIDLFLNNQQDALIIQILFCYKTLQVSGIFSAHHQGFSTVHSALVKFMQILEYRFQAQSGCSILTVLGSGHQKPA
jgi:predicted ATP-binding protein involved in virulence